MDDFDDIRPYNDDEAEAAYLRLMDEPRFQEAIVKCLPNYTISDFRKDFPKYHCIDDVQADFIKRFIQVFVAQSSTGFSADGIQNVDPDKAYLYIANHRDITFDSALLQYYFFIEKRKTSKIAIGDNLIATPVLGEVGRLNKMFLVKRSGSLREKVNNLKQLSAYIHYSLFEENASVWIAQRDGRTKDGHDFTKQGLLKMMVMGHEKVAIDTIRRMNITPLTVSYEYEPCDQLKARELALSENGHYTKRPGEDFDSIKHGIFDPKGQISLVIGKPLNEELDSISRDLNLNEQLDVVCELIDKQIYQNYKLYPNNYIAHDWLNHSQQWTDFYTPEQKESFTQYINRKVCVQDVSKEKMLHYLLRIYANPVDTHFKNIEK